MGFPQYIYLQKKAYIMPAKLKSNDKIKCNR